MTPLPKYFLSAWASPWLVLISSAVPMYVKNAAELQYAFGVLAPFAAAWIGCVVVGFLLMWMASTRRSRTLNLLVWCYYLSGAAFFAVSVLQPIEAIEVYLACAMATVGLIAVAAIRLERVLDWQKVSGVIALVSLAFVAIDAIQLAGAPRAGPSSSQTIEAAPAHDQDAATRPNIYHVVFDEFQTEMFLMTLTDQVKEELAGFTFYPDTSAIYGRTGMSLPSIFSGRSYDLASPQIDYQTGAFSDGDSVLHALKQRGYRTTAFMHPVFDFALPLFDTVTFHRDITAINPVAFNRVFRDLWVYSMLPRPIAAQIIDRDHFAQFQNQNMLNPAAPIRSLRTMLYVLDNERRLPANNRYTFVHLILPHFPYVLRSDCSYDAQHGTSSPLEQSRCATRLILKLVSTLKQAGRFNDSLIVIQADHGARFEVVDGALKSVEREGHSSLKWARARARSVLLIKHANTSDAHPFTVSEVPATLLDIAPTILSELGLAIPDGMEGVPLLNEASVKREVRQFYFFRKKGKNEWTDEMERFRIKGDRVERGGIVKLKHNPQPAAT